MATTLTLLSDREIPDNGGALVSVRVNWDSGATTFPYRTQLRIAVCREAEDSVWTAPEDAPTLEHLGPDGEPLLCYSGVPEQGATLYHNDPTTADDDALYILNPGTVETATLQPKWQWVRAYTPRLAIGLHYLLLQRYDTGTSAWVDVAPVVYPFPTAVNVLYRNRPGEVYAMRQNFPSPPYNPGPQTAEVDPILGG